MNVSTISLALYNSSHTRLLLRKKWMHRISLTRDIIIHSYLQKTRQFSQNQKILHQLSEYYQTYGCTSNIISVIYLNVNASSILPIRVILFCMLIILRHHFVPNTYDCRRLPQRLVFSKVPTGAYFLNLHIPLLSEPMFQAIVS